MKVWNDGVSSGENSIGQRPDTRICFVQRISNKMRECEGDGSQRKSEVSRRNAELQEVRQIRLTFVVYRFEGKVKQFALISLFNRKPVKDMKNRRYIIRHRSSTDESCSIVLNFLKFVNELLRTASE